jgi:hypothetical protein
MYPGMCTFARHPSSALGVAPLADLLGVPLEGTQGEGMLVDLAGNARAADVLAANASSAGALRAFVQLMKLREAQTVRLKEQACSTLPMPHTASMSSVCQQCRLPVFLATALEHAAAGRLLCLDCALAVRAGEGGGCVVWCHRVFAPLMQLARCVRVRCCQGVDRSTHARDLACSCPNAHV